MTIAAAMVAVISVVSATQFAFRASAASGLLIAIDILQTAFAVGIILAMRTRLRRSVGLLAFAFLTVVPVVPFVTLHLEPDAVVLVAASLALIPIGIALFVAWSERTYLLWAGTYIGLALASALAAPDSLTITERLETAAAIIIGLAFGIVGQRRRARHDRLAFDRARDLARLYQKSSAQQTQARVAMRIARGRIEATLADRAFRPFFQPIVDLRSGAVSGYEALTRFADGTRPDLMFGLAATAGLGVELESATIAAALDASSSLPAGAFIGLNASPDLLERFDLRSLLAAVGRPIVLEITEHTAIDDYELVRRTAESLGPSVTLAVDDAGAGYASLRHILELAPGKVKIDIGLVRGIDSDPARQALIAGLGFFADKRGIELVAEGIETVAELTTLRSLGVGQGQGYLLGRPQDGVEPRTWPHAVDLVALVGLEPQPGHRPAA
jgi:EAL domain-containing protein (putative c-di-GMP-specific phosphodiesterase class I)